MGDRGSVELGNKSQDKLIDEVLAKHFGRSKKGMQRKIDTLFDAIKHGDEDHQGWLKEAIHCHFNDLPMPEYVAGKPKQRFKYPSDAELMDVAAIRAANYDGDDRQDIKTDVINSFYAGADYIKKYQE